MVYYNNESYLQACILNGKQDETARNQRREVISLKKAIAIAVSLLFIFGTAGSAFARMGMSRVMESSIKDADGEIQAIDAKTHVITVKGMRGTIVTVVDEKTVIKFGKELKSFADLKQGQQVVVTYEIGEGRAVAKTVVIMPPAAPAEKKSEEKGEPKKSEEKK